MKITLEVWQYGNCNEKKKFHSKKQVKDYILTHWWDSYLSNGCCFYLYENDIEKNVIEYLDLYDFYY